MRSPLSSPFLPGDAGGWLAFYFSILVSKYIDFVKSNIAIQNNTCQFVLSGLRFLASHFFFATMLNLKSIILSLLVLGISGCTTSKDYLIRSDGRFLQMSSNYVTFFETEFLSTNECFKNYENDFRGFNVNELSNFKSSAIKFSCSPHSEVNNLPFSGSATNVVTGQVYPLRFKSKESCLFLIGGIKDSVSAYTYSCTEPLYDGMPKDRYCAIEKRVGKNHYGGISLPRLPQTPKVICD